MAFSSGASSALALVLFTWGLFAAFPAASSGPVDVGDVLMVDRFLRWQAAYSRSYPSADEKLRRFEVYRRNVEYIDATNRQGGLTYQLGENQFADLTQEEFLAMYTMPEYDVEDHTDTVITTTAGRVDGGGNANLSCCGDDVAVDAPPSVDWRARGAVVPPKSQSSSCASCWAFVTVATIESLHKIKTGKLVSLSEQQLVDCDQYDGGCRRGSYGRAYKWVVENGGMTTEEDYPYTAQEDYCNRAKASHHAAKISGYATVQPYSEAGLQSAVAQQPVAVAIEVGSGMQFYRGGVYSGPCGTRLSHAVTVVGYGADAETGTKYWIIKNSWGQQWGERGYLRMRRDVGGPGMCGITLDIAYPTM